MAHFNRTALYILLFGLVIVSCMIYWSPSRYTMNDWYFSWWKEVPKPEKPHIVFILADDLGFNDVGYHGSEIQTPNLDNLAQGGVRLENYYVQPICSPSRGQLLSGKYQIHTGLQHSFILAAQPRCLPTDIPTLPEKLREAGYATHMVGKWHLGFYKKECLPQNRGFDTFYGYHTGAEDYFTHVQNWTVYDKFFSGYDFWENEIPLRSVKDIYSVFLFSEQINKVIDQHNAKKPLFLYVPFQSVHKPLQVPDEYLKPYESIRDYNRKIYAGMTSCMDKAVGKIVDKLKEAGFWKDTILIFSTDNGGQVMAGGNNWPLRGWKISLWEGGVRAVGFIHSELLPQDVRGTISKQLMDISDWLPTLVHGVAGLSLDGLELDGFDMWDALRFSKESPRSELLHNIDPWPDEPLEFSRDITSAIRVGDWKLLTGSPGANDGEWVPPPDSGISVSPPSRLPGKNVWLFNITADPSEKVELSSQHPEVVDQLIEKLAMYYKSSVPSNFPNQTLSADPALHNDLWEPWQ